MVEKINSLDGYIAEVENFFREGEFQVAVKSLFALEIEHPKNERIKLYLGIALSKIEQHKEAIDSLEKALRISPKMPDAHYTLGSIFFSQQKYTEALIEFEKEIKINPKNPYPYCESAFALYQLKDYRKAINFLESAISLDDNYADAYICMGATLHNIEMYEDALKFTMKAIAIDNSQPEFYFTAGNIYFCLRKKDEALKFFNKAIELNSKYYDALYNKGLVHLSFLDFDEGWPLYEFRPSLIKLGNVKPYEGRKSIADKENDFIYIRKEQGIGDQILYASLLREFCDEKVIHMEIDYRLIPVFKRSFDNTKITFTSFLNEDSNSGAFFGMGSLGMLCKKNLSSFTNQKKPFLISDQTKTKLIRNKLLEDKPAFRIYGVSWKSNADEIGKNKSINLEQLISLLKVPNIVFVNLQYNSSTDEIISFCTSYNIKLSTFDDLDLYNDIDSLFSLIDACDAVITVSNINAHIAGALSKQTFLLAPFSKGRHWYWHDGLKDSLWYPSIEIFTQTETGDWTKPISDIKAKLIGHIDHE